MPLLLILVPLIVGYLLPRPPVRWLQVVNRSLSAMVYVILFLMGISLAFLPNLASKLLRIGVVTAVSVLCILAMNVLVLLEKVMPWPAAAFPLAHGSRITQALRRGDRRLCARSDALVRVQPGDPGQRTPVDSAVVVVGYTVVQ